MTGGIIVLIIGTGGGNRGIPDRSQAKLLLCNSCQGVDGRIHTLAGAV